MIKILIITDSLPFPPKNGKELPIAEIFKRISKRQNVEVDMLIMSPFRNFFSTQSQLYELSKGSHINVFYLGITLKSKWRRLMNAGNLCKKFIYNHEKSMAFIKDRQYDIAWISPYPGYDFVDYCRKRHLKLAKCIAIGMNDAKTYLYRDAINEMLLGKNYTWKYFISWVRSFIISTEERNVTRKVDLIHVQTPSEKEKMIRVLGRRRYKGHPEIIAEPNGIKEELLRCHYNGIDSNDILCMTQLGTGRENEAKWFLKYSWPIISRALPDARLLVVGSPPKKEIKYLLRDSTIKILGYVDDLPSLFNSVRISVVPTFHGTGLINRILDSLTAGVPTVSTYPAIRTFSDVVVDKHVLMGNNAQEMATTIINLYHNREKRVEMSRDSRQYAKLCNTWDDTSNNVFQAIQELNRRIN